MQDTGLALQELEGLTTSLNVGGTSGGQRGSDGWANTGRLRGLNKEE